MSTFTHFIVMRKKLRKFYMFGIAIHFLKEGKGEYQKPVLRVLISDTSTSRIARKFLEISNQST